MDNMGGLRKLYYIDAADFVSLVKGVDDIYTLTLDNGAEITEVAFTEDTGRISESEMETDNGPVYNFEVSCRIPKCGSLNASPLSDAKHKRILILAEDNNENFWLAGSPGSYFNLELSSTTGELPQEINARVLKIHAALMEGSVFIVSPL